MEVNSVAISTDAITLLAEVATKVIHKIIPIFIVMQTHIHKEDAK